MEVAPILVICAVEPSTILTLEREVFGDKD